MNDYFQLDGARSALETGTLRAEQGKAGDHIKCLPIATLV